MSAQSAERHLRAVPDEGMAVVPAVDALNRSAAFCAEQADTCDNAEAASALRAVAAELRLRRFALERTSRPGPRGAA